MGTNSDRAAIVAFVAMVVGIGGNVVAVKYIARDGQMHPLWAAGSRFVIATLLFALIALLQRAPYPRGRAFAGAALYGLLSIGGFFAFAYWGLQRTPVGVAGVFLATGPLLTFLFALAHGIEKFRWDSMVGAAIVVAGTAVVFAGQIEGGTPALSLLAILGASACAAEGAIVVKKFPSVHPAARNTIGMGAGALMLLGLMPLFDGYVSGPGSTEGWGAQVYLVTFGSIGVFGLYLYLMQRWKASAVSYEFVAAPLVGIALAAWLFDEQVTATFAVGAALVLAGVYLGTIRAEAGT